MKGMPLKIERTCDQLVSQTSAFLDSSKISGVSVNHCML